MQCPVFCVKSILRRDIVTDDCWFQNSSKISEYLLSRCDSGMSYVNHDAWTIDEKRSNKNLRIKGCIKDVITITSF